MIDERSSDARTASAAPPSPEPVIQPRTARAVLAVAVIVFAIQGWFLSGAVMDWNEMLAQFAAPMPFQAVMADGTVRIDDPCAGRRLVVTESRPSLLWCAAGLGWPIQVTPYVGGLHYWPLQLLRPLHHGDPIALRRVTLPIGILALIVVFLLVERLSDPTRAALFAAVAAVLPAVLILHALPALYELLPSLLIACAALVIAKRADIHVPPSPRRAAIAGLLAGLGVLANIKGTVILTAALAFAWLHSPVLRRSSRTTVLAALGAAALGVAPLMVTSAFDPQQRFGHEIVWRLSIALSRLRPGPLAQELFNLVANAADLGSYFDLALGGDGNVWLVTLVPYALALGYCVVALWRKLRGLPHDAGAAACATLQIAYLVFVWLSYNQVAANYSPIAYVFAVSLGCAAVAGAGWLATYTRAPRASLALALLVATVPLIVNTHRRDQGDIPLSINLFAERALGEYLERVPGGTVVVTTNALVGVPEAFAGIRSVRLDLALSGCPGTESEAAGCRHEVLVQTIKTLKQGRFVVPMVTGPVDKSWEQRMVPALSAAAEALQTHLEEEARFTTRDGKPALALMRVAAPPSP
ncbi:MAG: hypothetical protein ABIR79_00705 [Candidatus Binatia bacterium]